MRDTLEKLYNLIKSRQVDANDNSYTAYLFEQGLDKILKKLGEECAETIIAAKNADKSEIILEISDLVYHLMVLMVQSGIELSDISTELQKRFEHSGNLKTMKTIDKNT